MAEREPYREPPEAGIGGEGPITDQTVLAPTNDAEIAQAIRDVLFLDPDVVAEKLHVEVRDGEAVLTGRPRSPEERRRAVELASQVQSVRRVVDRLED